MNNDGTAGAQGISGAGAGPAGQGQDPIGAGNGPAGTPQNPSNPDPGKGQTAKFLDLGNGNKLTLEDAKAVLAAKGGLETQLGEYKKELGTLKEKLESYETKDLSEKQRLEREAETLRQENERLQAQNITNAINAAFSKHNVNFKPEHWAHGIKDVSEVEGAVQTLIKDNPHLVATSPPGPGQGQGGSPPAGQGGQGYAPPSGHGPGPGGPPPGLDHENKLAKDFESASSVEDLNKLEGQYHNLRGTEPAKGRQAL